MTAPNTPVLEDYRVWPDGTVQAVSDGAPYTHMSDDYATFRAESEEAALEMHRSRDKLQVNRSPDWLSLKWGSVKEARLESTHGNTLMDRYVAISHRKDKADEKRQLTCAIVDAANVATVYLDWDDVHVSKDDAKRYVMSYPQDD